MCYGGVHQCICGALSACYDYTLRSGEITNTLCVHYLALHRSEVPPEQLARVAALKCGEAEPTEDELCTPDLLRMPFTMWPAWTPGGLQHHELVEQMWPTVAEYTASHGRADYVLIEYPGMTLIHCTLVYAARGLAVYFRTPDVCSG